MTAPCPQCGSPVADDDAFCENCGAAVGAGTPVAIGAGTPAAVVPAAVPSGADAAGTTVESARTHLIAPPGTPAVKEASGSAAAPPPATVPACATCGGEISADGWCTQCGARAGNGREHVVDEAGPAVAVVSDIGRVHSRNEDSGAVAADGDWAALVVCDGVTSATDSDLASAAAVTAALDVLTAARSATDDGGDRGKRWGDALQDAARAADTAADETATEAAGDNPPSCTFVAAVVDGPLAVAGWVGDSRAYWLADDGVAELLTVDDSWAAEQIAAGTPRAVAEAGPQAHAITRWLGADSPDIDARVSTTTADGPGWLVVCSDGLWNYCSAPDDLGTLVADTAKTHPTPVALAEALVDWANEQGGHDNVTVALARIEPIATEAIATEAVDSDQPTGSIEPPREGAS